MNKGELARQARVVATLRPELDDLPFGPSSPCGLCGDETLGQRHRIIDSIAEQIRAGDHWRDVVSHYLPDNCGEQTAAEMAIYALAVSW